jgi:hypothetical protein
VPGQLASLDLIVSCRQRPGGRFPGTSLAPVHTGCAEAQLLAALDLRDAALVYHDLDGAEAQLAYQTRKRIEHFLGNTL